MIVAVDVQLPEQLPNHFAVSLPFGIVIGDTTVDLGRVEASFANGRVTHRRQDDDGLYHHSVIIEDREVRYRHATEPRV